MVLSKKLDFIPSGFTSQRYLSAFITPLLNYPATEVRVATSSVQEIKVQELKVHSQRNCFAFTTEQMRRIQEEIGTSIVLEPGINLVKLRPSTDAANHPEPSVMLWIYGGPVINQATDVEVTATWASLQGYEDLLSLDVKGRAHLCALFLDTALPVAGAVEISVARI
jgi:hypothetical protein